MTLLCRFVLSPLSATWSWVYSLVFSFQRGDFTRRTHPTCHEPAHQHAHPTCSQHACAQHTPVATNTTNIPGYAIHVIRSSRRMSSSSVFVSSAKFFRDLRSSRDLSEYTTSQQQPLRKRRGVGKGGFISASATTLQNYTVMYTAANSCTGFFLPELTQLRASLLQFAPPSLRGHQRAVSVSAGQYFSSPPVHAFVPVLEEFLTHSTRYIIGWLAVDILLQLSRLLLRHLRGSQLGLCLIFHLRTLRTLRRGRESHLWRSSGNKRQPALGGTPVLGTRHRSPSDSPACFKVSERSPMAGASSSPSKSPCMRGGKKGFQASKKTEERQELGCMMRCLLAVGS